MTRSRRKTCVPKRDPVPIPRLINQNIERPNLPDHILMSWSLLPQRAWDLLIPRLKGRLELPFIGPQPVEYVVLTCHMFNLDANITEACMDRLQLLDDVKNAFTILEQFKPDEAWRELCNGLSDGGCPTTERLFLKLNVYKCALHLFVEHLAMTKCSNIMDDEDRALMNILETRTMLQYGMRHY